LKFLKGYFTIEDSVESHISEAFCAVESYPNAGLYSRALPVAGLYKRIHFRIFCGMSMQEQSREIPVDCLYQRIQKRISCSWSQKYKNKEESYLWLASLRFTSSSNRITKYEQKFSNTADI
jgi:hypothetical protein